MIVELPDLFQIMGQLLWVDPCVLRLPGSRSSGADPAKLATQMAKYGRSLSGMPPIFVTRGKGGELIINDGATRATRAAKLAPGQLVPVEVIADAPGWDLKNFPLVKDRLP